ncbi:hypothetical protein LINPERHAP2_LOCUS5119 [Linum perenne]
MAAMQRGDNAKRRKAGIVCYGVFAGDEEVWMRILNTPTDAPEAGESADRGSRSVFAGDEASDEPEVRILSFIAAEEMKMGAGSGGVSSDGFGLVGWRRWIDKRWRKGKFR